jgi:hypothetical protein
MSTSVSSERAFSAAGITISKRHNRLGGDIVEALQFLKCFFQCNLLFREMEDPSLVSETPLEEQVASHGNLDGAKEGWDDVMKDADASDVLDMQGANDDDINILQLD